MKRGKKGWWCALGMCWVLLGASVSDADAATFSTVFAFDLHTSTAGVVEGDGGNLGYLFGTTNDTSLSYGGAIYKVAMAGGAPQIIYQLQAADGYSPQATLLLGSDHYLYGTTYYGPRAGTNTGAGAGTIFRVAQDGSGYQTLYQFDAISGINSTTNNVINVNGAYPTRALIESGGYLYGVTSSGGANSTGTVFRLRLADAHFELLHPFAAIDSTGASVNIVNGTGEGAYPSGSLTLASDGRLYGMTSGGGANLKNTTNSNGIAVTVGTGTIYSLNIDGTNFQTIHNFLALDDTATVSVNADGAQPSGKLLEISPGTLIGTASDGGDPSAGTTTGYGTVFRFDTATSSLNTLYAFDNTTGAVPIGNLVLSNGRVYGVTGTGSTTSTPVTSLGNIYSVDPVTAAFVNEHALVFSEGTNPTGSLILASNGDLFGTVQSGNACTAVNGGGYGAVFRYSLATNASSAGYSNCTVPRSSGGGAMSPAVLVLLSVLGLAPRLRRRVFGFI
ncbi:MAG: choice-of-anchor tandem repeat GloVer-containing protein [Steroidobacteraceae bacterium]